jgi:hypothetical protein
MAVDHRIIDALKLSDLKPNPPRNPRVVDIRAQEHDPQPDPRAGRRAVAFFESVPTAPIRGIR